MKIKTAAYIYIMILLVSGVAAISLAKDSLSNTHDIWHIWRNFEANRSEKSVALIDLHAELGFGGMLHHFKNYVLSRNLESRKLAIAFFDSVYTKIQAYKTLDINERERSALESVENTLTQYRDAVNLIDVLVQQGRSTVEIDKAVRVDDAPALSALEVLISESSLGNNRGESKNGAIYQLRKAIGYGGLIHHYKNYILRGEGYKVKTQEAYQEALRAFELYNKSGVNIQEQQAIDEIVNELSRCVKNLDVITGLRASGMEPGEIDLKTGADVKSVLMAFEVLNKQAHIQSGTQAKEIEWSIEKIISSSEALIVEIVISLSLVALLFIYIIYFYIVRRITFLTGEMKKLADGNMDIDIPWAESKSELGDMSRALQVFKENIKLRKMAEEELKRINEQLEVKVAERTKALQQNEKRLTAIFECAKDAIISIDQNGIVMSANSSVESIFGYTVEELTGNNVSLLMSSPDNINHDSYIKKYMASGNATVIGKGRDVCARRKDGVEFPAEISVGEIKDEQVMFVGFVRDLTERYRQEDKVRRIQKMDALGKLVGGVAHDFNNLLTSIIGYSDFLKNQLVGQPKLEKYATEVIDAGQRAAKMTHKLLEFSRYRDDHEGVLIELNKVLVGERELLERSLTSKISIEMILENDLWMSCFDIEDFKDCLLNLSINAMHAMPDGGELVFRTRNICVDGASSRQLGIEEGEYVLFNVEDTGAGMSDYVLEHLFEPFFTTKEENGTGLGLAQIYGFVKRFKGAIDVSSVPGKGSVFSLYFPRYIDKPASSVESGDEQGVINVHGCERILVVDDEPKLLELAYEILSHYGYDVKTASSGEEALKILETELFDIVLSDVVMRKMSGYELAGKIREKYPEIKIQLVSGYSDTSRGEIAGNLIELSNTILNKPYTESSLLSRIRLLLDSESV